jgi:hypothetical protein
VTGPLCCNSPDCNLIKVAVNHLTAGFRRSGPSHFLIARRGRLLLNFPVEVAEAHGAITPADHTFWAANFGATSGVCLQADGNNNGVVDAADYNIWRDNYTPPAPVAIATAAASAIVPTPPLARDLAPALPKIAGPPQTGRPIANSPPRRTDLLLAALEQAFVDWSPPDNTNLPAADNRRSDSARETLYAELGAELRTGVESATAGDL